MGVAFTTCVCVLSWHGPFVMCVRAHAHLAGVRRGPAKLSTSGACQHDAPTASVGCGLCCPLNLSPKP
eukprot:364667-Chlamydomonas_euryale.AAC.7